MVWVPPGTIGLSDAVKKACGPEEGSDGKGRLRDALALDELCAFIIDTASGDEFDVPASLWRTAQAETAFRLGRMNWQTGLHFMSAVDGFVFLDADDLEAWLNPEAETPVQPGDIHAGAYRWWLERAEAALATGTLIKRDAYIRECRGATGCTDREARAAFAALPSNLKRLQGQRDTQGR